MDQATTIPYPDQQTDGDHLAAGVLRALARSHRNHFSMSPARIGILGWLTFGVVPLWKLSRQFRDAVTLERQQYWHLAEWIRLRTGTPEAAELEVAAKRIGYNTSTATAGKWIALVFLVVAFASLPQLGVQTLINSTYGFHRNQSPLFLPIFFTWNLGVGAAYFMHWRQVRAHRRNVTHFATRFNTIAAREGIQSVSNPQDPPAEFTWAIPAVLLSWVGAWWSIPMMVAGAAQRGYINNFGQDLRVELLERVQAMMSLREPSAAAPGMVIPNAPLREQSVPCAAARNASYCSRCGNGTAAAPAAAMSEVA